MKTFRKKTRITFIEIIKTIMNITITITITIAITITITINLIIVLIITITIDVKKTMIKILPTNDMQKIETKTSPIKGISFEENK